MRKFLFRPNIRQGRMFALLFTAGIFNLAQAQEWDWAKSFGGTDSDKTYSVAADPDGNVYAVGSFFSPSITFGSSTLINQGQSDAFLVKYDSSGTPVFGIGIGNEGTESILGVGTDGAGNVYITGYYTTPTLNIGPFTLVNVDPNDTTDIFVAKLDSNGQVLWAKSAGTTVGDGSYSIAVDQSGNVFVTGYMGGPEMFFETYTLTSYGAMDIFTVKYDTDGNELWAVNAGGTDYDIPKSIVTDGMGNCYVSGSFSSATATFGFSEISNLGINDVFLVKYDENGVEQWVKGMGGSSYEGVSGLALGTDNDLYLTGFFGSSSFDFGNGVQLTNNGTQSVYIAKFNTSGDALWANGSVGTGTYMSEGITVDGLGFPSIIGEFSDSNFGFDSTTLTNNGGNDIFIFQFKKEDGSVNWSTGIGGSDDESGNALFADSDEIFVTGSFKSNSIAVGSTTLNNTSAGSNDSFVAKLDLEQAATNENSNLAAVVVYPNPSNGIFNLKTNASKVIQVEVLNSMGQRVFSIKPKSDNIQIDLTNKPKGVYLLKIQTEKGFKTKKLMVK